MHEGDSSVIHFNKDTDMYAVLAITVEAWWCNIINFTHFKARVGNVGETSRSKLDFESIGL